MGKKKVATVGKLKKDLWRLFALYIKRLYSRDGQFCECYTCGAYLEIGTSNCQAGHCLPKGGYSYLYFHENNVRPQCYRCNVNLSGNTAVFIENLKDEIGADAYQEMYETRHTVEKRSRVWYEEKIAEYKIKLKDLDC